MAVGDAVGAISSINAGAYLDIQPGAGIEWTIHNIYYAGDVELYHYDGSNSLKFDAVTGYGAYLGMASKATNSVRIRVKNVTAGAILISYDGVVTK